MSPRRLRWSLGAAVVAFLIVPAAWLMARNPAPAASALVGIVKRGDFRVSVTTSGELKAQKFVEISAPTGAQQAQVYQMKIASIVPEGTTVKAGDVVAELDRSTVASKVAEVTLAVQKAQAVYEQAMLDSTLNLSKAREDIRNLELGQEEKRLAKDQARYEAPTIQRQAEIDLEKAQRGLVQAQADYKTKTEQAKAKMREVGADLERQQNMLKAIQDVMAGFTIKAPAPGMVIYVKEWNGKKRTVGSQVSAWDPGVATLPDLTAMESVTYVNEIDVRKVAVGQPATITLDSDPTKHLTGKVTSVANMGEQRPNSDAKVFEVHIVVEHPDTTLRPGMTTGNTVETARADSALSIALEALNSDKGIPFVFKQSGGGVTRQEVVTGPMNEDAIVIRRGLREGDRVLLVPPKNADDIPLVRLPGSPAAAPNTGEPTAGHDTGSSARLVAPVPAHDTTSSATPATRAAPAMTATPIPR